MSIRINLLAEQQEAEEARRRDPVKRGLWVGVSVIALTVLFSISLQFRLNSARATLAFDHTRLESLEPEDPNNPKGQQYGYGIVMITFGPNKIYFHGGETPGYNSFIGYDPTNKVTLIVWTNLTVSLDQSPTANALMLKVLDQIYVVSPIPPSPAPTAAPSR
jgi:CubicO group peptidase (beta-lactamase class C family)